MDKIEKILSCLSRLDEIERQLRLAKSGSKDQILYSGIKTEVERQLEDARQEKLSVY